MKKEKDNPIVEYFANKDGNENFLIGREVFKANKDVDIKTDLELQEIQYINTLLYNNSLLKSRGLKPVYENFLEHYMRLKISWKRKSRGEFVDVNRSGQDMGRALNDVSNAKNVFGDAKK